MDSSLSNDSNLAGAPNPQPGSGSARRSVGQGPAARPPARGEGLGPLFPLLLLWLLFEFGRPPTPPGVPLLISGALFVDWLLKKNKQWSRQSPWWFVLLGVVGVGVSFAPNTYAAYFDTRFMAILILGMCLPLQGMLTSVRSLRLWIYAFLAVSVYVGAWATTHGGYGPAGAAGQDENYVAALMAAATALAYFALLAEKRLLPRLILAFSIVIFVAAIALAQNASRGGFLALCIVALYGIARSPRKAVGIGVLAGGALVLLAIAGPSFWKEIDSTTNVHEGTGDIRLELWAAGVRMWRANPVLGVGAGNFRWVIGDYQTPAQFAKFGRSLAGSIVAHSLPVECIAELGSVGAIASIVLVVATWRGLGKVRQQIPEPKKAPPDMDSELAQLRCYADALRGAILAILVAGTFLSLFFFSHLWVLLAVGSSVPFVYRRILGQTSRSASPRQMGRAGIAIRNGSRTSGQASARFVAGPGPRERR